MHAHAHMRVYACFSLLQGAIEWVNGRLCISHLVDRHSRLLLLIIVPASLRRTMFVAYHAAPTCGHMGRYKTLFRLRQRIFWPSMRNQVDNMVAACAHCALANSRKQVKSELMFGWPLDSPFCTLHVDLWSAGDANGDGSQAHLLNSMSDITQFVVSTPAPVILASALGSVFMQEVLLNIGFCDMVVVDDGSNFKGLFREMCAILKIRFHTVARGNHQALMVERFHSFLNKSVTLATNDRDNIAEVYTPASALACYAWNSSPIDGTDIVHSVPAVGREFRFPFDFEYVPSPTMTDDSAGAVHRYLSLEGSNGTFAAEVLKLLLEERRMVAREKIYEGRHQVVYKIDDVVTIWVQVQSASSRNRVGKLF
jgi:hypothetical protein